MVAELGLELCVTKHAATEDATDGNIKFTAPAIDEDNSPKHCSPTRILSQSGFYLGLNIFGGKIA